MSFNFATNLWDETVPNLLSTRQGHGMAFTDATQTKIIVAGGKDSTSGIKHTSEIYDTAGANWSSGPSMEPYVYSFATVNGILTAMREQDGYGIFQYEGNSWEEKGYELTIGLKFDTTMVYTGDLYQNCNPM